MPKIVAAPTRHHGYDFVAVLVKDHVVQTPSAREDLLAEARHLFDRDAILIGENNLRTFGDQRAVSMMRNIEPERLPWGEYEVQ